MHHYFVPLVLTLFAILEMYSRIRAIRRNLPIKIKRTLIKYSTPITFKESFNIQYQGYAQSFYIMFTVFWLLSEDWILFTALLICTVTHLFLGTIFLQIASNFKGFPKLSLKTYLILSEAQNYRVPSQQRLLPNSPQYRFLRWLSTKPLIRHIFKQTVPQLAEKNKPQST